ncbi:MAG: methyltransferase [Planctomycetota bacterium]
MRTEEWEPDDVLALASRYREACILTAAADLDLFAVLSGGPRTPRETAEACAADRRAVAILLDALTALRLLAKEGERYSLAPGLARLLVGHGPGSVLAIVRHQGSCLRRWAQLGEVAKTGRPAERVPSVQGEEADAAAFIEGMNDLCAPVAARIWDELGDLEFTHVLDVGGGSGTWLVPLLRRHARARGTLFDLPHVLPLAARRLATEGIADRVTLVAGDFYADPLPAGSDLVWLSAILHQGSRAENRALLARIHAALVPGGRILVRDAVMDDSRTSPVFGALFAVNMLVATAGGGTFTLSEIRADLEAAGFAGVQLLRADEAMYAVVGARKPGG